MKKTSDFSNVRDVGDFLRTRLLANGLSYDWRSSHFVET